MIKILDYGVGNVRAFLDVFRRLDLPAEAASTAQALDGATRLILPGVGAFDRAIELLDYSGMLPALDHYVHKKGIPLLGVCVGMQMLAQSSHEGERPGLGWVPGHVRSLQNVTRDERLPHMGWNRMETVHANPLIEGLEQASFYFLHSFYFEVERDEDAIAVADYGSRFACVVGRERIFGVQFHPEKSHHWGERLLHNFGTMPLC